MFLLSNRVFFDASVPSSFFSRFFRFFRGDFVDESLDLFFLPSPDSNFCRFFLFFFGGSLPSTVKQLTDHSTQTAVEKLTKPNKCYLHQNKHMFNCPIVLELPPDKIARKIRWVRCPTWCPLPNQHCQTTENERSWLEIAFWHHSCCNDGSH